MDKRLDLLLAKAIEAVEAVQAATTDADENARVSALVDTLTDMQLERVGR